VNFISCAVSADLIVIGTEDCKIYVHEVRDEYNLLRTIDLRKFFHFEENTWLRTWIRDITFLAADLAMVTTDKDGIFFVAVQSGKCISHFRVEDSNELYQATATVLSDVRICVGGDNGYCSIYTPPQEAEHFISEYTERMYSHPVLSLIPLFSEPLQATLEAVQNNTVSIALAVDLIVNTKYPFESIEKWARAHLIIMSGVKSGGVPRSRKYNGDVIFWWNHLWLEY